MSMLTKGVVAFDLAGEPATLKPSVRAFDQLGSGKFQSYQDVLQLLARCHLDTIKAVLRLGLGLKDADAKDLSEKIMLTGVAEVSNHCSDFVFRLFNNGKSAAEVTAELRAKKEAEEESGMEGAGADADADPRPSP